jgi:hypothetical protein
MADGWELDERELHYLREAGVLADQIAALDAAVARDGTTVEGSRGQPVLHPGIAEARQLRLAQHRLLRSLEMEDPAAVRARMSPTSRRASAAAQTRWASARAKGQL